MDYNRGTGILAKWLVSEPEFNILQQGKCEAILSLGNGYMGIRSATEESYVGQVRNCFVAGTFNRFDEHEVTELPNAADVTALDIYIDKELFSLEKGEVRDYHRTLNLKTGELEREFEWTNPEGKSFKFQFRRFVSFTDMHALAAKIKITPLNKDAEIKIVSGINGQMTNSGSQHFQEGERRVFDRQFVRMTQKTTKSDITFIHHTSHHVESLDEPVASSFAMERRKVYMIYEFSTRKGVPVSIEKFSNVYTSRDGDTSQLNPDKLKEHALAMLKKQGQAGDESLLEDSAKGWAKYWSRIDIQI